MKNSFLAFIIPYICTSNTNEIDVQQIIDSSLMSRVFYNTHKPLKQLHVMLLQIPAIVLRI